MPPHDNASVVGVSRAVIRGPLLASLVAQLFSVADEVQEGRLFGRFIRTTSHTDASESGSAELSMRVESAVMGFDTAPQTRLGDGLENQSDVTPSNASPTLTGDARSLLDLDPVGWYRLRRCGSTSVLSTGEASSLMHPVPALHGAGFLLLLTHTSDHHRGLSSIHIALFEPMSAMDASTQATFAEGLTAAGALCIFATDDVCRQVPLVIENLGTGSSYVEAFASAMGCTAGSDDTTIVRWGLNKIDDASSSCLPAAAGPTLGAAAALRLALVTDADDRASPVLVPSASQQPLSLVAEAARRRLVAAEEVADDLRRQLRQLMDDIADFGGGDDVADVDTRDDAVTLTGDSSPGVSSKQPVVVPRDEIPKQATETAPPALPEGPANASNAAPTP